MNAGVITAICAIVIALASLAVSIVEARANRKHNRVSVRPVLQLIRVKMHGDLRVGLELTNVGLGPAMILDTDVTLDGIAIGKWDRNTFDLMLGSNKPPPNFSALYDGAVIPAGDDRFLIFIDNFKANSHAWFWELIAHRLSVEITYESVYGGENFKIAKHPR